MRSFFDIILFTAYGTEIRDRSTILGVVSHRRPCLSTASIVRSVRTNRW